MKVTLGLVVSHGFPVPAPFVIGYSHLLQAMLTGAPNAALPAHLKIDRARALFVQDFPIDFARNRACTIFLDEDDGDHLLFLDVDMVHPPDLAHRLVAAGEDVVTARYTMRKPPFFSVAMRRSGDGPTDYQAIEKVEPGVRGLAKVDAGGAGALLISRRCLAAIRERVGDDWFRYQDGPAGLRSRSEDMWFYEQAIAAGFQPWLDADLWCKHIAQFEVDPSFHEPYADAYKAKQQEATA